MLSVKTKYKEGMVFEADNNKNKVLMDSSPKYGGQDNGMTPKQLVLAGLSGCTGMDVVSILKKMKVAYESFDLTAEADLSTEEPQVFTEVRLEYIFSGKDLPKDKIAKAVTLSQEKYCSVSAMLKKNCPVVWEIKYI